MQDHDWGDAWLRATGTALRETLERVSQGSRFDPARVEPEARDALSALYEWAAEHAHAARRDWPDAESAGALLDDLLDCGVAGSPDDALVSLHELLLELDSATMLEVPCELSAEDQQVLHALRGALKRRTVGAADAAP